MQSVVFVSDAKRRPLCLRVRDLYCGSVMVKFPLLSLNDQSVAPLKSRHQRKTVPPYTRAAQYGQKK